MLIIGVDPGSLATGYGILTIEDHRVRYLCSGTILLPRSLSLDVRLQRVFDQLSLVAEEHAPDEFALESVFYHKNFKAALTIGHVRGVVMLLAAKRGSPVFEYSPLQIKKALVGYGRASKEQVTAMAKGILGIERDISDDEADALAVAMCHANRVHLETHSDLSTHRGSRA